MELHPRADRPVAAARVRCRRARHRRCHADDGMDHITRREECEEEEEEKNEEEEAHIPCEMNRIAAESQSLLRFVS